MLLRSLQRGIESMYRVETRTPVEEYMIDESMRDELGVARRPREQLLFVESDDQLSMGLFVDQRIRDLVGVSPRDFLRPANFPEFLLAIEGVSHFVYVVLRAKAERQVSGLELELQAEVDKYLICLLSDDLTIERSQRLRQRLFVDFEFDGEIAATERERYLVANENARSYSASLERRFVRHGHWLDLLREARRFYRMSLSGKLQLCRAA